MYILNYVFGYKFQNFTFLKGKLKGKFLKMTELSDLTSRIPTGMMSFVWTRN